MPHFVTHKIYVVLYISRVPVRQCFTSSTSTHAWHLDTWLVDGAIILIDSPVQSCCLAMHAVNVLKMCGVCPHALRVPHTAVQQGQRSMLHSLSPWCWHHAWLPRGSMAWIHARVNAYTYV